MAFNVGAAVPSSAQNNIESVQYIRAMAAIIVVVTHAFQWPLEDGNYFLLKSGRFGVDIFFVISGFIITLIAGSDKFDPRKFLARRARRIVPAYWVATILVTALALLLPQHFRSTVPTVEGFIKSLVFLPSEDPKAPLLALGWTLDYEAFFYFVFACTFWLRSEWRTLVQILFLGALIVIGRLLPEPGFLTAFYTSPSLIGFIMGLIVGQAYRHSYIDRIRNLGMAALIVIVVLLAGTYYFVMPWPTPDSDPLLFHLVLSLLSALIVAGLLAAERNGSLPSLPLIKFFGDASYSIYLFHLFPLGAFWAVSRRLFDITPIHVYLPLAAICSVGILTFGVICYWLVERPFLARRERPSAVLAHA
jgi:exopolysaccharide production protein ExoZ